MEIETLVQIDNPVGLLLLHELPKCLGQHRSRLVRFAGLGKVAVGVAQSTSVRPGSQRVFCFRPGVLTRGTTMSFPRWIGQWRICSAAR